MSIIHDALKKIQSSPAQETASTPADASPDLPEKPGETDTSSNMTKRPLIILMAVLLSIVVLVLLGILYKLGMETTQHPKSAATAYSDNKLHIEGVMEKEGKKTVLINGNVYEEGQAVNGSTITSIAFDSITVTRNGEQQILPTKP